MENLNIKDPNISYNVSYYGRKKTCAAFSKWCCRLKRLTPSSFKVLYNKYPNNYINHTIDFLPLISKTSSYFLSFCLSRSSPTLQILGFVYSIARNTLLNVLAVTETLAWTSGMHNYLSTPLRLPRKFCKSPFRDPHINCIFT